LPVGPADTAILRDRHFSDSVCWYDWHRPVHSKPYHYSRSVYTVQHDLCWLYDWHYCNLSQYYNTVVQSV